MPLLPLALLSQALLSVVSPPALAASGDDDVPTIPFEKYELPNGLDVILAPDSSVPFVWVNVWYHVGSRDEIPGRTGFAHLFEHLMFQGSAHADDDYFQPLQGVGGQVNGTTNTDRTNYFEGVPSQYLPLALFLESDRMGWLLPALTEEKLANQKEVVRNERRQRYENRPYGNAWVYLLENTFPEGHPYHVATIGRHEDIDAAKMDDVKAFFQTWYVPQNASLVIAGDFDTAEAKALVTQWFGDIPGGPVPAVRPPAPVTFTAPKVVRYEEDVPFEKVWMVWPSPKVLDPGDAELDLVARMLAGDKQSRLYEEIVYKRQIAQDISVSQNSMYLAGMFMLDATVAPGHTAEELIAAIDEVLEDCRKHPFKRSELSIARTSYEVGFYESLLAVQGKANLLNNYNFLTGNPGYLGADLARYQDASRRAVNAAFERYVHPTNRLVMTISPKPPAPATVVTETAK